jgi:hypothetical protein
VQALMTRIERLEQALGGGRPPVPAAPAPPKVEPAPEPAAGDGGGQAPAPQPEPPRAAATPPERAAARAEAAVAASAVMEPEPEPAHEAEPAPPVTTETSGFDLDQLKSLWPAVVEAVCAENQMVGACLDNGRPRSLENGRLTVCFGEQSEFAKKAVERKRELPAEALRQLTGQTIELVYEVVEGEEGDAELASQASSSLSNEQFLERLKEEFGATEVFDEQES